jgi:hypothetical protein
LKFNFCKLARSEINQFLSHFSALLAVGIKTRVDSLIGLFNNFSREFIIDEFVIQPEVSNNFIKIKFKSI